MQGTSRNIANATNRIGNSPFDGNNLQPKGENPEIEGAEVLLEDAADDRYKEQVSR